jgi:DNA polymerase III gamma/tau subunit
MPTQEELDANTPPAPSAEEPGGEQGSESPAEQQIDANTPTAPSAEEPDAQQPPEGGQEPEQGKQEQRWDRHPRSREVIQERNRLRNQVKELTEQLSGFQKKPTQEQENKLEKTLAKLKALNWGDEHIQVVRDLVEQIVSERVTPAASGLAELKLESAINAFAKDNPDFDELIPEIEEAYRNLSPRLRDAIAAEPSGGLALLYNQVKNNNPDELVKKGEQKAYGSIRRKKEGGTLGGSPTGTTEGTFTEEQIEGMDDATYEKNRVAIQKAIAEGRVIPKKTGG